MKLYKLSPHQFKWVLQLLAGIEIKYYTRINTMLILETQHKYNSYFAKFAIYCLLILDILGINSSRMRQLTFSFIEFDLICDIMI